MCDIESLKMTKLQMLIIGFLEVVIFFLNNNFYIFADCRVCPPEGEIINPGGEGSDLSLGNYRKSLSTFVIKERKVFQREIDT